MKRLIFLLIGIFIMATACQDDFVEPDDSLKSAKYEKTQTFQIKGWATVNGDDEAPNITCTPEYLGIEFCSRGWISGHENILGTIVHDESTYEKLWCVAEITPEGPVALNVVWADMLRTNGNRTFGTCYMYINVVTGDIWGYFNYEGGTGRFEGLTGTTQILNAKMLPDGGISWDEEGEITLVLK
ncbi:hypothetical protein SLH46_05635 [Draconibacterium sp. IB214405]|uniref:hypothetical protein n=1 Tax=Draconibacterium sp. IB214405 TaxID=3097352 RepID=UPI002A0C297A|nr:hypothetical protein [Draconibacterium sp. IB214405]MDX8338653.1 hypothetical protein [Draconibacterium sp. IB214405]